MIDFNKFNPLNDQGYFGSIPDPIGIRDPRNLQRIKNDPVGYLTKGGVLGAKLGWYGDKKKEPVASMSSDDYYAGLDAQAQDDLRNFFASLGGPGAEAEGDTGGGSGYDAGAMIRQMMDSINQSYDTRKSQVGQNRAAAMGNLENAIGQFKTNVGANQASYVQGSNQVQQAITQRAAQAAADAAARQQQLEASMAGIGGNAGAIAAQAQGNLTAAQQSTQAQQDLGNRINQIADFNQRGVLNSGDLVRQGAVGQLENQYTDIINALDMARQQELASAQSAGSGGGGGGGGGGGRSSSGGTAADRKAAREQSIVDSAFANNDPNGILAALFAVDKDYANYVTSTEFDPSIYEPLGLTLPQYRAQVARSALIPYISDQAYRQGSLEDYISNYQVPRGSAGRTQTADQNTAQRDQARAQQRAQQQAWQRQLAQARAGRR